jgi:hypothetical protein
LPLAGTALVAKADMLSGDLIARRIGLKQKSLSAVLKFIYSGFGCRYGSRWYDELEMRNKDAAMAEVDRTHDWLYDVLQKALDNKDARAG